MSKPRPGSAGSAPEVRVRKPHNEGQIIVDGDQVEVNRAEALFVSYLQPSQWPTPDEVREAISTTLRVRGTHGCAAVFAEEFGEHPDTAAGRMTWALSTVHAVYATAPIGVIQAYTA
jgi:hypothetical protein